MLSLIKSNKDITWNPSILLVHDEYLFMLRSTSCTLVHACDVHTWSWSHMFDTHMMHTCDHTCLTHTWFTCVIHTCDLTLLDLHAHDLEFLWSHVCHTCDHTLDTHVIWSKWIMCVSRTWSHTCADMWCTHMILFSNHMSVPLVMI